jgi:hypothetical protein
MARAADTLGRHKNPGSDAAGVVGVTSRAIETLAETCTCERHSRILGASTGGDASAGDKFDRSRSTA